MARTNERSKIEQALFQTYYTFTKLTILAARKRKGGNAASLIGLLVQNNTQIRSIGSIGCRCSRAFVDLLLHEAVQGSRPTQGITDLSGAKKT
jgi:hypothetical protein